MDEFDLVLKNGKVFFRKNFISAHIGILNGKISKISKQLLTGDQILDCSHKLILPGLIDVHVHFRTPGQEYKENWHTGSSAALAGGVTSVMDMPNNSPSIITEKRLNEKRKLIAKQKPLVNYGFHFGLTSDNASEFARAQNCISGKLYAGSTTGDLLVPDENIQEKIFTAAKNSNKIVFVHAENEAEIQKNQEKYKTSAGDPSLHSNIRSVKAEVLEIEKLLSVQSRIQNRLHFCHVSSAQGIELISQAKQNNPNITCEVTPHHLFLSNQSYSILNNFAKVNPSLKSKQDISTLWNGIQNNAVDVIATDHAPHTIEEKSQDYWTAPSGMPGLETMLPLLLTEMHKGNIPLEKITQLCSENPAKLLEISDRKGSIEIGMDADLIAIDPHAQWTVKNDELFTKCKWSAFEDWKLRGRVTHTWVNGSLAFTENQIITKTPGKELAFSFP